jgi:hypothetical protein
MHRSNRESEPEKDYERAWVGYGTVFSMTAKWSSSPSPRPSVLKITCRRHCQRGVSTVTNSLGLLRGSPKPQSTGSLPECRPYTRESGDTSDPMATEPGLHISNCGRSSYCGFFAEYRYRSKRLSAVKLRTHDRNRCSPSKLLLPSTAISYFDLLFRASYHSFAIWAALSVVSVTLIR